MSLGPQKRLQVFRRDNYKCIKCGSTSNLTADHILPRSKGGTNDLNNLRTLCDTCNSEKGNFNPTFKERIFSFLLTRREANTLRNEMLSAATSKVQTAKDGLNARIDQIKPTIIEHLAKVRKDTMIEAAGFKNTISINSQRSAERDDKLLQIIYRLSDRIEAMEKYLDIEFVEEEIKEYRKRI